MEECNVHFSCSRGTCMINVTRKKLSGIFNSFRVPYTINCYNMLYFRNMKAAKKRIKREGNRKTVICHGGNSLHTYMESNKFLENDNKIDDEIVNKKECLPTIPVIIIEENSEVSMSKKSKSNGNNEEDKNMVKISDLIESDEANESFTKIRETSRKSLLVIRT
uniref:PYST-C1 domain-containing protein n=1 Tax=Strongyloides venezuelensis TaxID=75913 RepID=A0A0K0FEP3_STRVS